MRSLKIFVFLVLTALLSQVFIFSESNAGTSDAAQNVKALNHLSMSLYRIANYNNKAVLDEEYETIINDIKLDALGDKTLVGIIQELMDALTAFRISEEERTRMKEAYEQMQEDLMMNMLLKGGMAVGTELAHTTIKGAKGLTVGGPWGAAAAVISSAPSLASSATKPLAEMNMQKQKLEDFEWQLDADKLKSLNELNKKFLATYWDFLHDSNVPDSLRISGKQIGNLLDVNKEKDPAARYRLLIRLETECGNIPSYWYYRADAAHDILNSGNGLEASQKEKLVSDIQECLDHYRELAGMLRKDNILASLLMLNLDTASLTPEEARTKINQIVEPFPLDASKRLFAALTSLKYGLTDEAIEHLNANIDMRQYEVISRKLLSDIYEEKNDEQNEAALIQKLINDDSASNQEILYHLGKLQDYEKFMAGLEPQLSSITMQVKPNIVGDDDVEIIMPIKWEIIGNGKVPSTLRIGGKEFESNQVELTKDRQIRIVFKKAMKEADLSSMHSLPVSAVIQTRHFPLILEGRLEFPEVQAQENKGMMSKIKGTAKRILPKSQGAFQLANIRCEDMIFSNENGKWVNQRARRAD